MRRRLTKSCMAQTMTSCMVQTTSCMVQTMSCTPRTSSKSSLGRQGSMPAQRTRPVQRTSSRNLGRQGCSIPGQRSCMVPTRTKQAPKTTLGQRRSSKSRGPNCRPRSSKTSLGKRKVRSSKRQEPKTILVQRTSSKSTAPRRSCMVPKRSCMVLKTSCIPRKNSRSTPGTQGCWRVRQTSWKSSLGRQGCLTAQQRSCTGPTKTKQAPKKTQGQHTSSTSQRLKKTQAQHMSLKSWGKRRLQSSMRSLGKRRVLSSRTREEPKKTQVQRTSSKSQEPSCLKRWEPSWSCRPQSSKTNSGKGTLGSSMAPTKTPVQRTSSKSQQPRTKLGQHTSSTSCTPQSLRTSSGRPGCWRQGPSCRRTRTKTKQGPRTLEPERSCRPPKRRSCSRTRKSCMRTSSQAKRTRTRKTTLVQTRQVLDQSCTAQRWSSPVLSSRSLLVLSSRSLSMLGMPG